jgi:hypothetical protein
LSTGQQSTLKSGGGLGVDFDKDGLQHHYNIYVYTYSGTDLFYDIESDLVEIPFHGGETYRQRLEHPQGATLQVGCDFGHLWNKLDAVATHEGKPPVDVVLNAVTIEEYIMEKYGEESK